MKYFLDADNSGHWYVIPAGKRLSWKVFLELPIEDERCWDVPYYAILVDGPVCDVEFENPEFMCFGDPELDE